MWRWPWQVAGILRTSTPLCRDIGSFKEFKSAVEELQGKLDAYQKEQFQVRTPCPVLFLFRWWFGHSGLHFLGIIPCVLLVMTHVCLRDCLYLRVCASCVIRSGVTSPVRRWKTASCPCK